MIYRFNTEHYNRIFAVPSILVEKHIRLAGAAQLKVLLWLLSHSEDAVDDEALSKALGLSTADVSDAMQYWIASGLVADPSASHSNTNEISADDVNLSEAENITDEKAKTSVTVVPKTPRKTITLTRSEALATAKQNPEISWLLKEAQSKLGRTLSSAEMTSFVSMNVNEGLPCAVILMIIEYAVANEHFSIRYIDAIAAQWAADEVNTVERAEAHLKRIEMLSGYWRKVQSAFSMEFRRPSKREEMYAERWIGQWHFSQKMLRKAYDACVDSTGKVNMPYINKVLDAWQSNGLTTTDEVDAFEASNKDTKKSKPKAGGANVGSFETKELYNLFWKPEDGK